MLIKQR